MQHGDSTSRTLTQTLGRYRLLKMIGKGGMGEVWLAEDPRLHRQVAIKTLPTRSQDDREFLLRFEREAQAAATLNHPHILPVYDYGEQPLANGQSITYIVMPYVSGGSLSNRVMAFRGNNLLMPPQEALLHLMQAAEAIDYAHDQGVVHRDIKPGNMLMRAENWLLLADFGIARIVSSAENLTQTGVGFGTPEYMAPEQAQGKAEPSSDNYSLAVIAYHLFTGRLPFKADTGYATTIQHLTMPPPQPRQFNPSIPAATEAVLLHGLAKTPVQRPPSSRAFVSELQRTLTGITGGPIYSMSSSPPVQPSFAGSWQTPEPSTTGAVQASATTAIPTALSTQLEIQPKAQGISRRNLLIGGLGGAALIAGGGVAVWALTSSPHRSPNPLQQTPPLDSSTANPGGPNLILRGHNSHVWSLAWSPVKDSLQLVSAGKEDNFLFLWDIQQFQSSSQSATSLITDKNKAKLRLARNLLTSWSSDGKYIAIGNSITGSGFFDTSVSSFTVYSSDLAGPIPGFDPPIAVKGASQLQAITWLQNKYVVTGHNPSKADIKAPNTIQLGLIDITQSKPQRISVDLDGFLPSPFGQKEDENYLPVVGSPDGSLLAVVTTKGTLVGKLIPAGRVLKWQPQIDFLKLGDTFVIEDASTVSWSANGKILATLRAGQNGKLGLWHWAEKKPQPFYINTPQALTTIAWSPAPAPADPLLAAGGVDGTIYIWNITGKNYIPSQTLNSGDIKAPIGTLAWSSDGHWLAAGLQDNFGSILIWKVN